MVTGRLADVLEALAGIAGDSSEAAKSLAKALRRGTANVFWGGMLMDMAGRIEATRQLCQEARNTGTARSEGSQGDEIRSALLEKAQSTYVWHGFPDLAAAYEGGLEYGPRLDEACSKRHEAYVRRCNELGYAPCERRTFKSPDRQRWAVNYLRHKCSGYRNAYRQLQAEARETLGPHTSPDDLDTFCEQIHQIIKNRVQDRIAEEFPELAEAAEEQKV